MKTTTLKCASCGAPLKISSGISTITCSYCGCSIVIERDNRDDVPGTAKISSSTIKDSGQIVRDVVRENLQNTLDEMQRLQMQSDITYAKMRLSDIKRDIHDHLHTDSSSKSSKQLGSLRASEYALLEKIRMLENQCMQPDSSDLSAYISWTEREKSIIEAQIRSLKESDLRNRSDLINDLKAQNETLYIQNQASKIRLLTRELPSFQKDNIDLQNAADIENTLMLLSADEATVRKKYKSIEGKTVYDEIKRRKKTYIQALKDKGIHYDGSQYDQPGTFGKLTFPFLNIQSQNGRKSISLSGFFAKSTGRKSTKKGIFLGVLIMMGFSFLAAIFLAILTAIFPGLSENFTSAVSFFFIPIGFFFGACTFLMYAAPDLTIRGIAGLPDITLESWKTGTAIKNLAGVRLLVGGIVFHQMVLIAIFLSAIISPFNENAASVMINIGGFIGLGAGILAAVQTIFTSEI